jgi:hypothetical protein
MLVIEGGGFGCPAYGSSGSAGSAARLERWPPPLRRGWAASQPAVLSASAGLWAKRRGLTWGVKAPRWGRSVLRPLGQRGRVGSAQLIFSTTCESAPAEVGVAPRLLYPFIGASCETA